MLYSYCKSQVPWIYNQRNVSQKYLVQIRYIHVVNMHLLHQQDVLNLCRLVSEIITVLSVHNLAKSLNKLNTCAVPNGLNRCFRSLSVHIHVYHGSYLSLFFQESSRSELWWCFVVRGVLHCHASRCSEKKWNRNSWQTSILSYAIQCFYKW